MRQVKQQYEKYPYPPLPLLALPARGQGQRLSYETGMKLTGMLGDNLHKEKRILVAGAGTLEALVVAQAHPYAKEIVAVDLSAKSIQRLKQRVSWARANDLCRFRWGKKLGALPRMHFAVADLMCWQPDESFDYIIASNMLHHVEHPAALLHRLSEWLAPGGLMRIVTYSKQSRLWLRWVGQWLRLHGITPESEVVKKNAWRVIKQLPQKHPIRQCFETHTENQQAHGIVDAFLHACENPLSALEWQAAISSSGLKLLAEQQNYLSSSDWLLELVPQTKSLSSWQRLQILDDLLELTSSPVFWLVKSNCDSEAAVAFDREQNGSQPTLQIHEEGDVLTKQSELRLAQLQVGHKYRLPSLCYWQLKQGVDRAEGLLNSVGESVANVSEKINVDVCRDASSDQLSLAAYSLSAIHAASEPWEDEQWQGGEDLAISYQGRVVPGKTLAEQARWLQLRHGPEHAMLDIRLVKQSG